MSLSRPMPPYQHPLQQASAWLGSELAQQPQRWTIRLEQQAIDELEAATEQFIASGADPAAISPATFPLPTLATHLASLRTTLTQGLGFQVWKGLPVQSYSMAEVATLFCGLGSYLGKACSQNSSGHLLGHVKDTAANAKDGNVRIYQTNERQTFHTDSADVVGLLCLRAAKMGGDSLLVSTATVYNGMLKACPELLAELFRPIATDRRGEVPAGALPYFMIPVLNWFDGHLTGMYQRQYIESAVRHPGVPALSDSYTAALDCFDQLANEPHYHLRMRLEPGDIQFVHNHSLLHDRTGFTDWPKREERRHLLRLWLSIEGDRELPEVFAQRFGRVTVGDRGGIITPDATLHVPLTA